jgi:hypothetical protein
VIFRTPKQKADLLRSWHRPDRPFFATGACHILAAAFLKAYPDAGFCSYLVIPEVGMRGNHVFVANRKMVFDYHGFCDHDEFIAHYFRKIRRFLPDWEGKIIRLEMSPTSEAFCDQHGHRLPSQYPHDPFPRASAYLKRFSTPGLIAHRGRKPTGPGGNPGR